jgi:hypothetical protein
MTGAKLNYPPFSHEISRKLISKETQESFIELGPTVAIDITDRQEYEGIGQLGFTGKLAPALACLAKPI